MSGYRRTKRRTQSSNKHQVYLTCLDLRSGGDENSLAPGGSGQTSTQMAVGFPQSQETLFASSHGGKRVIKLHQEASDASGPIQTFGTVPYDFYGHNQSEEEDDDDDDEPGQTQICTTLQSSLVPPPQNPEPHSSPSR